MLDKILTRYNDPNYVLKMHFIDALKLFNKTEESEIDEKLWEQWLVEWQHMTKENFENFNTYKEKRIKLSKLSSRTKEAKNNDINNSRKIANEAMRRLNPKNDLHIKINKK